MPRHCVALAILTLLTAFCYAQPSLPSSFQAKTVHSAEGADIFVRRTPGDSSISSISRSASTGNWPWWQYSKDRGANLGLHPQRLPGTWSVSLHSLPYGRRHRATAAGWGWEDRIAARRLRRWHQPDASSPATPARWLPSPWLRSCGARQRHGPAASLFLA